jgi:hypothetical protein
MRRPPVRSRLLALAAAALVTAVAASVTAPRAAAAPHVQFGLTDDAWILDGPGTLDSRLDQLQEIGVQIVRLSLNWNQIAPSKPADATDPDDSAYDWSVVDPAIQGLRDRKIDVLLQLVGTPAWANGGRGPNYAPDDETSFGDFARAAAERYSWVRRWLIWNEPNQVRWLRPTSPSVYTTRLLNPAYAAIHEVIPKAEVGGGATAPRGATHGVSPIAWLEGMHAAGAELDAYAQNPYPLNPKSETPRTGGCDHCTTVTMATLGRLLRLVKSDFGKARVWLTEYGYQTNPPDKILGVAPTLQARYLAEAAYVAWHTPRVDMLIHFLYRDEPELGRFQSGLLTIRNGTKPAYHSFELPLMEIDRKGGQVSLWGQLRAADAGRTAVLEQHTAGGWRPVATLHGSPAGYVKWQGTLPEGTKVRLAANGLAGAPLGIH